jgi:flagellum-specific peptidoglycan hydrolase FlgJ
MVTAVEREAVKVSQTILAESSGGKLIVDGRWGTYTQGVFDSSPPEVKERIAAVLSAYNTSPAALRAAYRAESLREPSIKAAYLINRDLDGAERAQNRTDTSSVSDTLAVFKTQVVPEVIRQATAAGLNAQIIVAQLRLESANGKKTSGRHNYAGIKALKGQASESVLTTEFEGGQFIKKRYAFRSFSSPAEFVTAYISLITNRRYGAAYKIQDNQEAAKAIKAAGYATDPAYATKLTVVANSVKLA